MKFVAAIVVFSLICIVRLVSTESQDKEVKEYVKGVVEMCQAKLETPNETVKQLMRGDFDDGGADEGGMCHITCMMEEFGTLENGNNEAYETFLSNIDDDEAVAALKTCQLKTGKNDCEIGYEVYLCVNANADIIFKSK